MQETADTTTDQIANPATTRRQALAQAAIGTLVLLSTSSSRANMPYPEPLTLEEEIRYYGRWIFTGRLRRAVFLSPSTAKKLFTPDEKIDPAELKLYERHELKTVDVGFLEIEDAAPVLMKHDIPPKELAELATGTIYCYKGGLGTHPEMDAYIASLVGKTAIFFFHIQIKKFGVAATSFPSPLYEFSSGRNWRDNLPLPIDDLPKVTAIAQRLGFVKPASRQR